MRLRTLVPLSAPFTRAEILASAEQIALRVVVSRAPWTALESRTPKSMLSTANSQDTGSGVGTSPEDTVKSTPERC
ncbi:hypothetical protein RZ760_017570 [Providencia rettgeri]|uniref:Uncharacterized protein n=1 Tax=Providencia stuartii TaxID=588 RepID=A0AAI9DEP3_PROST|nr:hypothetical protein [Providencia stuartii]MDV5227741.1 hypothetical protein [Providencia rettgeri]